MNYNIILCGVGGQGVLSLAAIIASSAGEAGLIVRQSEVHGMAQRGGAVLSHLRISDKAIHSDLVPRGNADLILSMEPLEVFRYIDYLSPKGKIFTSSEPFVNIPNYPEEEDLRKKLEELGNAKLIQASKIAFDAGSKRASNMVMIGAVSDLIPIDEKHFLSTIEKIFTRKGMEIVEVNKKAFFAGKNIIQ